VFGFLKGDNTKKLRAQHRKKAAEALLAQRNGDLNRFAELSAEADALERELDALERQQPSS